MAYGIEPIHVADIEQEDFEQGEEEVQAPEPLGSVHGARVQFVVVDAVHLGHEQLHAADAQVGDEHHSEHDDGQTAHPLRQAAPQQDVLRNRLDVGKDGGSCSGEARQGFKKSVCKVRNALTEQERQSSKHR